MSTDDHLDALLARYPDSMTVSEVSEVLRMNEETTRRLLASGKLPGYRVSRHWLTTKSELRDYLQARHNSQSAPQETDND